MASPEQEAALFDFLSSPPAGFDGITFVVSSVPFVPEFSDDQWTGYKEQRARIFNEIASLNGRSNPPLRVCMLSGDVHQATYTELTGSNNTKIVSLVSSPLSWNGVRGHGVQNFLSFLVDNPIVRACLCRGLFAPATKLDGWNVVSQGSFIQDDNYIRANVTAANRVTAICNSIHGRPHFTKEFVWPA
jgi:phosphodiesterase/alkaline phosphatase D-like protein